MIETWAEGATAAEAQVKEMREENDKLRGIIANSNLDCITAAYRKPTC
jgi:hypothetical protein